MTQDERQPFVLEWHQVPQFPLDGYWVDQLRWCVAVMDWDDPDLPFAASLLYHAARSGLTKRQEPYADKIIARVVDAFSQERLRCQQPPREHPLSNVEPEGEA